MFVDVDGLVNLRDFALFQNCFTGNDGTVGDACACADYDGNDRVGWAEFKAFLEAMTP